MGSSALLSCWFWMQAPVSSRARSIQRSKDDDSNNSSPEWDNGNKTEFDRTVGETTRETEIRWQERLDVAENEDRSCSPMGSGGLCTVGPLCKTVKPFPEME
ncbi:hypothetical protein B0J15DRAFT_457581 [Fusarium solani]|uniref:Secreted protein n=1 Tax=Fusarium solani TaxID=169388 RepID=A0A9P9RDC1_FUSSL|nr:uncharacterized protein B0J15DRAFT_457581 [Fusarium solani]KAH7275406.1 hypothetical protein B0J15DRAFT_457581 [Fusarium solani]